MRLKKSSGDVERIFFTFAEAQDEYQVKQKPEPVAVHIAAVTEKCLHSA